MLKKLLLGEAQLEKHLKDNPLRRSDPTVTRKELATALDFLNEVVSHDKAVKVCEAVP